MLKLDFHKQKIVTPQTTAFIIKSGVSCIFLLKSIFHREKKENTTETLRYRVYKGKMKKTNSRKGIFNLSTSNLVHKGFFARISTLFVLAISCFKRQDKQRCHFNANLKRTVQTKGIVSHRTHEMSNDTK